MYENLRKIRNERKLTQAQAAEKIIIGNPKKPLTRTTYANYESGITEPDSEFWIAVADLFKVSIDYLMGFCDDPNSTKYAVNFQTSQEEKNLVRSWRSADDRAKEDVAHALRGFGFVYVQQKEKEA